MYYNYKWIWENICVHDSHDMKIKAISGTHCFIIGQHINSPSVIEETAKKLINSGFQFFKIFGEHALLWKKILLNQASKLRPIQVEVSQVDRQEQCYTLSMFATLMPKSVNLVLSDDEYFTEWLVDDLREIFAGGSKYSPKDWKKFREGFEFNYCGKDAVVSISNGIIIGYIGKEKFFDTIWEAFSFKCFDGKCFDEVWKEISLEK